MAENSAMTIIEFLEARIAEDEELATADSAEMSRSAVSIQFDCPTQERFNPTRVLAECAAKRAIIEQHQTYAKATAEREGIAFIGARCGQEVTGDVLKVFAAAYKDHPDYQQEWSA